MQNNKEETVLEQRAKRDKRLTFVMNVLNVSPERAFIIDSFIADITNLELSSFFKYRINHEEEKLSKELVTLNAYKAYKKDKILDKIKKREFYFLDFDDMVHFIRVHFENQDVVRGVVGFGKDSIMRITSNGYMVNSNDLGENGFARKLEQKEEIQVYEWLYQNQTKIGDVPMITDKRKEKLQKILLAKLEKESGLLPFREDVFSQSKEADMDTKQEEDETTESRPELDINELEKVFSTKPVDEKG